MKVEFRAFTIVAVFLLIVTGAYLFMTHGEELAGTIALFMSFLLCAMIAGYLYLNSRSHPARPEDRKEGEIAEGAGDVGFFPPRSYWPLFLGATMALGVLLAFSAFSIAGQLLDVQIGFGIVQVFDPATQRQVSVLTSLIQYVGVLVFFLL